MAASLPITRASPHISDLSAVDRMSRAGSRASTAFWHDRGRPEDAVNIKKAYIQEPKVANVGADSSWSTTAWHGTPLPRDHSTLLHGNTDGNITERVTDGDEISLSGPRGSKMSLFGRSWSLISSILQDLEPVWAHRRMEAAKLRFSRPYTPSVYSSRTMDESRPNLAMRLDSSHIISRLSDIVEESWRDRSILKTPEPAALIYGIKEGWPPYRGNRSDWDIENGSMI